MDIPFRVALLHGWRAVSTAEKHERSLMLFVPIAVYATAASIIAWDSGMGRRRQAPPRPGRLYLY